ncbi:MAG: hypothetical protein MJ219_01470 [Mycoplasmoidaceae bacterium]|nr:hypothetical protein [Mycoplasmoidaceae bacterium]
MATRIKRITPFSTPLSHLPLVIGYFGSIHVMHAELLSKYHHYNVLTFTDFSRKSQSQLYRFKERINNIARFKPDNIFIYDLNKHNMTADQFIKRVLLKMQPSEIAVGNDFKFGSDGKRYTVLLGHFKVNSINYNPAISTTKIIQLLSEGKVDQANNLLYFPYYYVSR